LKDIQKLDSLQKLYIQNNKFLSIPYEMKDAFPNLIQITLEWFMYLENEDEKMICNFPPTKLRSLFSTQSKKDLYFTDLNL